MTPHPSIQTKAFCIQKLALSALFLCATLTNPAYAADDSIATDRPDFVESSDTVGKSRIQIETSVSYSLDHEKLVRTWSTPTLFRLGTHDNFELRLETEGYTRQKSQGITQSGMSDVELGFKWHMQDQKGMQPSTALLVHAAVPSGSQVFRTNGVRPSIRGVAEWEFGQEMAFGIMPGLAYERDEQGERHMEGILGITVSKGWTEQIRTFAELSLPKIAKAKDGGTQVYFDTGATWLVSKDLQFDIVLNTGLNDRSDRYMIGLGMSKKF
jgi:hypothetical protein